MPIPIRFRHAWENPVMKRYESGTANTKKGAEQIAAHKTLIKLGFTGKEI